MAAPGLDLVICHFGMPGVAEDGRDAWEPWASRFAAAARCERCVVKVSEREAIFGGNANRVYRLGL